MSKRNLFQSLLYSSVMLLSKCLEPCRRLLLHKSNPFLLKVAPNSLQSLSFEPRSHKRPHHPAIGRLTGLTHLELINVGDSTAHGIPLHSLGLRELFLNDCPSIVAKYLAAAGDLRCLRKVQIGTTSKRSHLSLGPDQEKQEGLRISDLLRTLAECFPQLEVVSMQDGSSSSFS